MAYLVEALFLGPLSRGFEISEAEERARIMKLINCGHGDYISLIWRGARSRLTDSHLRVRLLSLREKAIEHGRSEHKPPKGHSERSYFINDVQVKTLFPLNESENQTVGEVYEGD